MRRTEVICFGKMFLFQLSMIVALASVWAENENQTQEVQTTQTHRPVVLENSSTYPAQTHRPVVLENSSAYPTQTGVRASSTNAPQDLGNTTVQSGTTDAVNSTELPEFKTSDTTNVYKHFTSQQEPTSSLPVNYTDTGSLMESFQNSLYNSSDLKKQTDANSVPTSEQKTTVSPAEFFQWLNNFHPRTTTVAAEEASAIQDSGNGQNDSTPKTEQKTSTMSPEEFMKALNNIHGPGKNETSSTPASVQKATTMSPADFFLWLNNFHPRTTTISAEEASGTQEPGSGQSETSSAPKSDQKTTTASPADFFQWLNKFHPMTTTDVLISAKENSSKQESGELSKMSSLTTQRSAKVNSRGQQLHNKVYQELDSDHHGNLEQAGFTHDDTNHSNVNLDHMELKPELMPPMRFLEWLNSIHPDKNVTSGKVVPAKNVVDTSIITTEKLIIVISTICGTFVLFVVILIIVSCCRRRRNVRSDSEKSDFSVTSAMSAVSVGSTISTIPEKREVNCPKNNGYANNDLFMGIPPNNKIWRELEQLPPTASSVMPESTRM